LRRDYKISFFRFKPKNGFIYFRYDNTDYIIQNDGTITDKERHFCGDVNTPLSFDRFFDRGSILLVKEKDYKTNKKWLDNIEDREKDYSGFMNIQFTGGKSKSRRRRKNKSKSRKNK